MSTSHPSKDTPDAGDGAEAAGDVVSSAPDHGQPDAPADAHDDRPADERGIGPAVAHAGSSDEGRIDAPDDADGTSSARNAAVDAREDPGALDEIRQVLEAALLVAGEPVPVSQLARLFDPPLPTDTVRKLLEDLRETWSTRKVVLVQVASGWRFQGKPDVQRYLDRLTPERPPRYSRAVMETLAIIAYQQPVTRGDIEAIRGVAVSTNVVKTLEDRQWIEAVGHRETPGRPALYATTKAFLDDLGLTSLAELPPLAELDSSHLMELPDAPTKAAETTLPLASPILGSEPESAAEPGAAGDRGQPAPDEAQTLH